MKASDEFALRRWVFGYGSLIWRVDFPHRQRRRASIRGWARRFWQGSHDHRGTPSSPGRVVTLVPEPSATCVGVAYQVDESTFAHLDYREKNGYERVDVHIRFADSAVPGTVYIAAKDNPAFLGPASLEAIARHICCARGPSGSNKDYLLELAAALADLSAEDAHVEALAALVASAPDDRTGAVPEGVDFEPHRAQQRQE